MGFFHVSISWGSFTGVWVTSLLSSPVQLLSILVELSNAIVSIVSTSPLISKSSHSFTNSFLIVPRAPVTIGVTVTFMFHNFFSFPSKVLVLIPFAFFQFYSVVSRDSKVQNSASSLFCWFIIIIIIIPWEFFILTLAYGFHWSLRDSKSPQVSRTFLSIEQSPPVPLFPSPPVLVLILWWLYQECQLQLV